MKYFLILILSYSTPLLAQIATSSLFSATKSINPAVVSLRPAGTFSLVSSHDNVNKDQDLSELYTNGEASADILVNQNAMFYGGKGGGFTSEIYIDVSTGQKITKLLSSTQESKNENELESTLAFWSMGFSKDFGLTIGMASFNYNDKSSYSVSGYSNSFEYSNKSETAILRLGTTFGSNSTMGAFLEVANSKNTSELDGEDQITTSSSYLFGFGFASRSNSHHYELSFEFAPSFDAEAGSTQSIPQRYMLILEQKFSFITLGYSGRLYRNGFGDIEKILYTQLVYNNFGEDRIENVFNFSFGSERGHSLSGSVGFSNATIEDTNLVSPGSDEKYSTTITEKSIAIKYAYNF